MSQIFTGMSEIVSYMSSELVKGRAFFLFTTEKTQIGSNKVT
jgi:hypothetical protein